MRTCAGAAVRHISGEETAGYCTRVTVEPTPIFARPSLLFRLSVGWKPCPLTRSKGRINETKARTWTLSHTTPNPHF
eukprot:11832_5